MKIPGINQTGLPGAEQISLGAISSAANAKMQTNSALNKVVNDYQTKVVKAETDEEYSRLANGFSRDTSAAWQDIQDQDRVDEYGAPTHSTMMEQYQSAHDNIAKDYNGRVKFNPNKSAFTQFADQTLTRNTSAVRGEVGRRTIAHLSGAYEQSRIDLMQNPNGMSEFAEAQQAALKVGLITPGKMATDFDVFQHEFQTNQMLSDFNSERDLGRGQAYVDQITGVTNPEEGEQVFQFPDSFDDGEKLRLADKMESDLRGDAAAALRIENELKREAKALEIKNWNLAKQGQRILEKGMPITDELLSKIQASADVLVDDDQKKSMQLSFDVYHNIQELMSMTQEGRLNALNTTYSEANTFDEADLNASTRSAVNAISQVIAKDPHQAWVMFGGGAPMEEITEDNLAESLIQLQTNELEVSAWLGEDTAPMSLAQLNQIKKIGVSGLDEILTSYDEVEAAKILTLLYEEDAGEMAVVGSLALQDDGGPSYEQYMAGSSLVKQNPDWAISNKINTYGDTARQIFDEATKGLFAYNQASQNEKVSKSMQLVADKIYIMLAKEKDMLPGHTDLDVDLYNQAITMAVGSIAEYNEGAKILLPDRSWDLEKFEDAIKNLTKEQIEEMGGFRAPTGPGQLDAEATLELIKDGEATLRQGDKPGQYFVYLGTATSTDYVANPAGEHFILDLSGK